MKLPLEDIRVLDFTRAVAGPYATMLLGDMGADVVKIEDTDTGDLMRTLGPPFIQNKSGEVGDAAYFLAMNRNKRSVSLDLKNEQSKEIVGRLIQNSDVVIENFRPGVMKRLGFDLKELQKIHPELITCSISGYGTGSNRAAYDVLIQAESGLMSITGEPDGEPMKLGVAVTDVTAAMMATISILAALRQRDHTGRGQHIDIPLLDTTIAWLLNVGQNYLVGGKKPKRLGNAHPNIAPYQIFQAGDGGYVSYAGAGDKHFMKLCDILGVPELAKDPHFSTSANRNKNQDELLPIIKERFKTKTAKEWEVALQEVGLPVGRVKGVDEVLDSQEVKNSDMIWEVQHSFGDLVKVVGNPIKFSETKLNRREAPPMLGEHTTDILKEIGYSENKINLLRDNQIIR